MHHNPDANEFKVIAHMNGKKIAGLRCVKRLCVCVYIYIYIYITMLIVLSRNVMKKILFYSLWYTKALPRDKLQYLREMLGVTHQSIKGHEC